MKSEISVKSSIHVTVNSIDLTLTRQQAINLRDALNKELGEQWNWPKEPIPPMKPYIPQYDDWKTTPINPNYPSYPQVWCGSSVSPKDGSFTANSLSINSQ